MTLTCDHCGGPRINGAAVVPMPYDGPTQTYRLASVTDPRADRVCRDCAKEAVGDG